MAQRKCCEESYGRQSTLYNIDKALEKEKIFVLRDGGGKIATPFTYKGNNSRTMFPQLCFIPRLWGTRGVAHLLYKLGRFKFNKVESDFVQNVSNRNTFIYFDVRRNGTTS